MGGRGSRVSGGCRGQAVSAEMRVTALRPQPPPLLRTPTIASWKRCPSRPPAPASLLGCGGPSLTPVPSGSPIPPFCSSTATTEVPSAHLWPARQAVGTVAEAASRCLLLARRPPLLGSRAQKAAAIRGPGMKALLSLLCRYEGRSSGQGGEGLGDGLTGAGLG